MASGIFEKPPSRQCKGTTSSGAQCKKFAIRGGLVCPQHGGMLPSVKQAAAEACEEIKRLSIQDLIPKAMQRLETIIVHGDDDAVAVRAITTVLDRAGGEFEKKSTVTNKQDDTVDIDESLKTLLSEAGISLPHAAQAMSANAAS